MKALLLHADRDFDPQAALPPNRTGLTEDLGLELLFRSMAQGDEFVLETVRAVVLASLVEPEEIRYRQQVLTDCAEHPTAVRELYDLVGKILAAERKIWGGLLDDYAEGLLHRSVAVLALLSEWLKKVRQITDRQAGQFRSKGFTGLFATLSRDLDDDFFKALDGHLKLLAFSDGVSMTAVLGGANESPSYLLLEPRPGTWRRFVASRIGDVRTVNTTPNQAPRSRSSTLSPALSPALSLMSLMAQSGRKQESSAEEDRAKALSDLRGRGISSVAISLAQAADDILAFLRNLRFELAFYVGCLNLGGQLAALKQPTSIPEPLPAGGTSLNAKGLYDVCLSLSMKAWIVPNDFDADGKTLVMITGANKGGKSTFLRSVGQAQLMMQAGMFVAAKGYRASACDGLFTHFKREEDVSMRSGRLDEELSRMSEIVNVARPGSMVLANESFASTNEREGSEIARQIVRALTESGVRVLYVTHLFDLANGFFVQKLDTALFLRAERQDNAGRTFKVLEAEPLPTSYGEDLYRQIFGTSPRPAAADKPATGAV
jgi:ABC-type hemin transport system ATPase subunit